MARSGEDVIRRALRLAAGESLRLQVEHRAVAAAQRHELVVCTELDHAAMFQNTDAVRMTHRRESMRNEYGGAPARGGQDAIEDLGFAAHVELRGGLVEH